MIIPPLFIRLRIQESSSINLWLPLFLLWLLLLPFVILFLPFIVILLLVTKGWRGLLAPWLFYQFVCSFRGLRIDVKDVGTSVKIIVW